MTPAGRVQFHMNRPSFSTEHDRLIVEFIFVGEMLLTVSPVNEIGDRVGLTFSVSARRGVKTRIYKTQQTRAYITQIHVCILEYRYIRIVNSPYIVLSMEYREYT